MADTAEYNWIITCKTSGNGIIEIHNVRYSEIIQYRWLQFESNGSTVNHNGNYEEMTQIIDYSR